MIIHPPIESDPEKHAHVFLPPQVWVTRDERGELHVISDSDVHLLVYTCYCGEEADLRGMFPDG